MEKNIGGDPSVNEDPTNANEAAALSNETEEEFAKTIGRFGDILNACRNLRARLLLTQAGLQGGSLQAVEEDSDITSSINKLEEEIHRVSIQEEALRLAKVSSIFSEWHTKGFPSDIVSLLEKHAAHQAEIVKNSEQLRLLDQQEQELKKKVLHSISSYISLLESDRARLMGTNISSNQSEATLKKKTEQNVKDIRFMQLCISEIVSSLRVDLRNNPKIKAIIQDLRDPITTVDQFF